MLSLQGSALLICLARKLAQEEAWKHHGAEEATCAAAQISEMEALLAEAHADIAKRDSCLRAAGKEVSLHMHKAG